jgi:hypothetical protein
MLDSKVLEVLESEVRYARGWDAKTGAERPEKDADKSVEFWVLHLERYVQQARDGCKGVDKTPALEAIRKIAALCYRCMENKWTPKRDGELKPY